MRTLLHRLTGPLPTSPGPTDDEPLWTDYIWAMEKLFRGGVILSFEPAQWRGALCAAELHGWAPRGVIPARGYDLRLCDYTSGEDWWVGDEDAHALADALVCALARHDLPATPEPPGEAEFDKGLSDDETALLHQVLWALYLISGEPEKLQDLIRFCRGGAFQIRRVTAPPA